MLNLYRVGLLIMIPTLCSNFEQRWDNGILPVEEKVRRTVRPIRSD
jgi:hypothetical protein